MHQNQLKKIDKNLDKTIRIEDYKADKALKTKTNKIIREIRKQNHDEDKILRDLDFTFGPEKDHYKLQKLLVLLIITIFSMQLLEIKTKNISVKEYIDIIRPYLSDIINNHKTQGEWKIHSSIITDYKIQGE